MTQHNDTQHNDTQNNDTQNNGTRHIGTHHNDIQQNDAQYNKKCNTQFNGSPSLVNVMMSVNIPSIIYAEC
jgi:hypothetical protein